MTDKTSPDEDLDEFDENADGAQERVDAMVDTVKARGFITSGEIFAALADLEPETEELAAIYASLRERGVEVVDEISDELKREDERRMRSTTSRDERRDRIAKAGEEGKWRQTWIDGSYAPHDNVHVVDI
jgi:sugar phosphate isomerase/epimerase